MKIFRARKEYSPGNGGKIYYFHADIEAHTPKEAKYLCESNKIVGWRFIDQFDYSEIEFIEYTVLGEIQWNQAKSINPYIYNWKG